MNKTELIQAVSERAGMTKKDAGRAVETVFEVIAEALARGERVQVTGFGHFEIRERAARLGRNPHTGEVIQIAPSRIPAFRAGKLLREGVR
jgi:DNA-binding protein HU-beta